MLKEKKEKVLIYAESLVKKDGGHVTLVLSKLLSELDSIVNFLQRCLPVELLKFDESIKPLKDHSEQQMYSNLANLVKWVDMNSAKLPPDTSMDNIRGYRVAFSGALENLVKLAEDNETAVRELKSGVTGSPILSRSGHFNTLPARGKLRADTLGPESSSTKQHNTLPPTKHRSHSIAVEPLLQPVRGEQQPLVLNKPRRSSQSEQSHTGIKLSASADDLDRNNYIGEGIGGLAAVNSKGSFRDSGIEQSPRSSTSGTLSNQESPPQSLYSAGSSEHIMNGANHHNGPEGEVPPPIPMKKSRQHKMHSIDFVDPNAPPLPPKKSLAKMTSLDQSLPAMHLHLPETSQTSQPMSPGSGPPIPYRITSDPTLKSIVCGGEEATNGPRIKQRRESQAALKQMMAYDEQLLQSLTDPEAPPPIPPKRKHIEVYQGLLGMGTYEAPSEVLRAEFIEKFEKPPPLPPKKKKRPTSVQEPVAYNSLTRSDSQDHTRLSTVSDEDDAPNFLELEDVTPYLVFNKEEEGGYSLRGGVVDALVAYASSPNNQDKLYTEAFLLIYPTFITLEDLLLKLTYRLKHFFNERNDGMWQSCASLLIRLLKHVRRTLGNDAQSHMISTIHLLLSNGKLKFAQLLRESLKPASPQEKGVMLLHLTAKRPKEGKPSKRVQFLDLKPDLMAQQMTLLDSEVFQKVEISEMLLWAKEQNEERSPTLTKFTEHFNNVSQWTKTVILDKVLDRKGRDKVLLHFIAVMKCLREYNNFNSLLCILSAIESASVSRLDYSDKVTKALEEHKALIDSKASFKNYRDAFAAARPPCIPYIGLYLQDLTFINFAGETLEDKESINFTKRWRQYNAVDKIRVAQTKAYIFEPDPHVLEYFDGFREHKSDDELYKISLQIKPRGGG
jgi:hypothetical protein